MDDEKTIASLEATGQYRVLRRFSAPDSYCLKGNLSVDPERIRTLMAVDVETTGLQKETERIIDLGFVLAEFDRVTGQVLRVL